MKSTAITVAFGIRYTLREEGGFLEIDFFGDKDTGREISSLRLEKAGDEDLWTGEMEIASRSVLSLRYRYKACKSSGIPVHAEPGVKHRLPIKRISANRLFIQDLWIEPSREHVLSHPALRQFAPETKGVYFTKRLPSLSDKDTLYHIPKSLPYPGDLVVVGGHPLLGRWNPENGLFLSPHTDGGYSFRFPFEIVESEYKFVLITPNKEVLWEDRDNRLYTSHSPEGGEFINLDEPVFQGVGEASFPQFEGTAVPLFSLRTERSYGAGDLSDAKAFIDWQAAVGQRVLQFLPLYDTRFQDSPKDTYPYNATTTIGLHPLFLDVRKLPFYDDAPSMTREDWERKAKDLNAENKVNYTEVLALKLDIARYSFRRYISSSFSQIYDELKALFGDLYETVLPELIGYAYFYAQKKRSPHKDLSLWQKYAPEDLEQDEEYYFSLFLQLHLYRQLEDLAGYARSKGILLKGDLPIGVGRNSADAWMHPKLFHLDMQAGSPPDAFSADGQNWGFPTYDWEEMRRDNYAWWRKRLTVMGRFFSLIRVDHILGFFRIYSIPVVAQSNSAGYYVPAKGYWTEEVSDILAFFEKDTEGLYHPHLLPENDPLYATLDEHSKERILYYRNEYYYRRNEELWKETALERITGTLSPSSMIICAEDLGVLPKSVTEVLRQSEILSLEVLRMSKKADKPYVFPEDIPYLSVLTTSTHDTSTMREWWLDELDEKDRHTLAEHYGVAASSGAIMRALRKADNLFLILPLQDWLTLAHYNSALPASEERINVPSNPDNVWDYRMPGFVRDLPADF